MADHPRQEPGTAVTRYQANLHKALGKQRLLGGNAHVAHHREITAGANRRAVNSSNDGYFQRVYGERDSLDAGAVTVLDLLGGTAEHTVLVFHVLDVAAAREGRTGPGNDGHPHRLVRVDGSTVIHDGVHHFVFGNGVAGFVTVQRHGDDSTLFLVKNGIGHESFLG